MFEIPGFIFLAHIFLWNASVHSRRCYATNRIFCVLYMMVIMYIKHTKKVESICRIYTLVLTFTKMEISARKVSLSPGWKQIFSFLYQFEFKVLSVKILKRYNDNNQMVYSRLWGPSQDPRLLASRCLSSGHHGWQSWQQERGASCHQTAEFALKKFYKMTLDERESVLVGIMNMRDDWRVCTAASCSI